MTAFSLAVAPFDPLAASPQTRLAVGRLLATCHASTYPEDPPLLPEREAIGLTHVTPGEVLRQLAVWDGEQALGWASLEYHLTQNLHAAPARLFVHPGHRRRELGWELARALEEVARQEGRRVVTCGTSSRAPAGEAFAQLLRAGPALPWRQESPEPHGHPGRPAGRLDCPPGGRPLPPAPLGPRAG